MTLTGVVLTMLFPLFVWISRGLTLCLCPLTSWRSRWRISLQRVGQSSNASWGSCRSLSRGCWKNMLLGKTHTPYTFMQRVFMMWSWVQRDCVCHYSKYYSSARWFKSVELWKFSHIHKPTRTEDEMKDVGGCIKFKSHVTIWFLPAFH